MKKEGFLGVRLEKEIHEKLQQYAEKRGISLSVAVRELLVLGLKASQSWVMRFFLKLSRKKY